MEKVEQKQIIHKLRRARREGLLIPVRINLEEVQVAKIDLIPQSIKQKADPSGGTDVLVVKNLLKKRYHSGQLHPFENHEDFDAATFGLCPNFWTGVFDRGTQ